MLTAQLPQRKPLKVRFDDYIPEQKQKLFHDECDRKRFVLLVGGVRSGKTIAGVYQLRRNIYLKKLQPNLHWIVAPIYDQAAQACIYFEQAVEPCILRTTGKPGRPMTFWLRPPQNYPFPYVVVEVKSAADPSHLRGRKVASVLEDESRDFPEEAHNVLMQRVLDTRGQIVMTTTTRGMNHWLYERVYTRFLEKDPEYGFIQMSTYDNSRLRPEDIQQLERDFPAEYGRQELYGEFLNLSGLVYAPFSREKHVLRQAITLPNEFQAGVMGEPVPRVFVGVDFGFSDPCVILWVADWKGQYWVVAEHCESGKIMEHHARVLANNPLSTRAESIYTDPHDLKARMELIHALEVMGRKDLARKVFPAPRDGSGKDPNFMVGVRLITRLLLDNQIAIVPECVNLIREFGQYRFVESAERNVDDRPADRFNHGMDALRYALRGWAIFQHGRAITRPGAEGESVKDWSPVDRSLVRTVPVGSLEGPGDFPSWYL